MEIYTGNFANASKYGGLVQISIALSAKYFNGICYRKLNPSWRYMNEEESVYRYHFNKHLSTLSPFEVYKELESLSNGKDIVLLCHEKEGDFCHRHIVAEWLSSNLGIEVLELGRKGLNKDLSLF